MKQFHYDWRQSYLRSQICESFQPRSWLHRTSHVVAGVDYLLLFLHNSDQVADFSNRPIQLESEAHFFTVITDVNVKISGELLALNLYRLASVIAFVRFLHRYPRNSEDWSVIGKTSGLITALLAVMIIGPDCQNQHGMRQSPPGMAVSGIRRRPVFVSSWAGQSRARIAGNCRHADAAATWRPCATNTGAFGAVGARIAGVASAAITSLGVASDDGVSGQPRRLRRPDFSQDRTLLGWVWSTEVSDSSL